MKNILVATPQPAFGELLRLSLEESGRYQVRLVQTGREALASAEHILFSLVILDAALDGPPFPDVANNLRSRWPEVHLLVIPPSEGRGSPEIEAIARDGSVEQPFYAPNLVEMIDNLTSEPGQVSADSQKSQENDVLTSPDGDAAKKTSVLENFLKDSSASGVMLLRSRHPWAWAGQLNVEALNEVSNLLARYISTKEGVDLARFVHLHSNSDEYLVYATLLPADQVLVMVYPVATPLTVIRNQAGRLARLLPETGSVITTPAVARFQDSELNSAAETNDGNFEDDTMPFAGQQTGISTPEPAADQLGGDWVREVPENVGENDSVLFSMADETFLSPTTALPSPSQGSSLESNRPLSSVASALTETNLTQPGLDSAGELVELSSNTFNQSETSALDSLKPVLPADPEQASSIEDTQPVVLRTLQSIQQVQPIGSSLSHLAYTCVLIPRLPTHALDDLLAARLGEWLPQLCLAYGWRIEGLLIRPEYFQWTVQVAPAISPGNVVRLIRQQSSRRIFMTFPQFEVENPSGDFWAPSFLIISGFQPPSLQLVFDFIHQTRTRQIPW